jgi:hypothetical protein
VVLGEGGCYNGSKGSDELKGAQNQHREGAGRKRSGVRIDTILMEGGNTKGRVSTARRRLRWADVTLVSNRDIGDLDTGKAGGSLRNKGG